MRFVGEGCQILDQRKEITCIGYLQGNLYTMDIKVLTAESAKLASVPTFPLEGDDPPTLALVGQTAVSRADLHTWHRRLGHLNTDAVSCMLSKNMVTRMHIIHGTSPLPPCKPCIKGKQTHAEIQKTTDTCSNFILGCIFSDVCSHMPVKSHDGFEYFIT